jgi:hypothetical protein
MRRLIVAGVALVMLVVLAVPAQAARVDANTADDAVAWDSTRHCSVILLLEGWPHEAELSCSGSGTAWVKVKVPHAVTGKVTEIRPVGARGDCSGRSITYRKHGHVVTVKITHTGDFDCTYKDIVVFFS